MRRAILVALGTGVVITGAAAIGLTAALAPTPKAMSREDYDAALHRLEALHTRAQARCEALDGDEAGLCLARLRADDRVMAADLEAVFRRTEHAARDAQRARIDARYEIDRARCEALKGMRKDKCLIDAHATKGRALLEAAAPYSLRYSF
jgi:hyperosmotically inducible protein